MLYGQLCIRSNLGCSNERCQHCVQQLSYQGAWCCACCRESLIFDTGTIKLADFGLSKSLPVNKHAGYDLDSKFKLTGETGSYRYMAPEVFRHEPYNFKVLLPSPCCCSARTLAPSSAGSNLHGDSCVPPLHAMLIAMLSRTQSHMSCPTCTVTGRPWPDLEKPWHGAAS